VYAFVPHCEEAALAAKVRIECGPCQSLSSTPKLFLQEDAPTFQILDPEERCPSEIVVPAIHHVASSVSSDGGFTCESKLTFWPEPPKMPAPSEPWKRKNHISSKTQKQHFSYAARNVRR
jgi:hypothetical protein